MPRPRRARASLCNADRSSLREAVDQPRIDERRRFGRTGFTLLREIARGWVQAEAPASCARHARDSNATPLRVSVGYRGAVVRDGVPQRPGHRVPHREARLPMVRRTARVIATRASRPGCVGSPPHRRELPRRRDDVVLLRSNACTRPAQFRAGRMPDSVECDQVGYRLHACPRAPVASALVPAIVRWLGRDRARASPRISACPRHRRARRDRRRAVADRAAVRTHRARDPRSVRRVRLPAEMPWRCYALVESRRAPHRPHAPHVALLAAHPALVTRARLELHDREWHQLTPAHPRGVGRHVTSTASPASSITCRSHRSAVWFQHAARTTTAPLDRFFQTTDARFGAADSGSHSHPTRSIDHSPPATPGCTRRSCRSSRNRPRRRISPRASRDRARPLPAAPATGRSPRAST